MGLCCASIQREKGKALVKVPHDGAAVDAEALRQRFWVQTVALIDLLYDQRLEHITPSLGRCYLSVAAILSPGCDRLCHIFHPHQNFHHNFFVFRATGLALVPPKISEPHLGHVRNASTPSRITSLLGWVVFFHPHLLQRNVIMPGRTAITITSKKLNEEDYPWAIA